MYPALLGEAARFLEQAQRDRRLARGQVGRGQQSRVVRLEYAHAQIGTTLAPAAQLRQTAVHLTLVGQDPPTRDNGNRCVVREVLLRRELRQALAPGADRCSVPP